MSAGSGDPAPDPLIGVRVGGYVLRRVIGEGGMGRVYLAEHPTLETRVAVKVLAEEYRAQAHMVDRFFDEARSVNRIQQENIVNILDLSQLPDGRYYIVMEFLEGETLLDRLRRDRKMRVEHVTPIAMQVLAGLAATHRMQIVHRDLKPANIFLCAVPGGIPFVKLLDFGVAKLANQKDSTTTITGTIVGTPTYMAPEQAAGRPADIDHRSDLYSLGVVIYQLLTGTRPFKGDSVAELYLEQMTKTPLPARQLDPFIPDSIEDFLIRALQREKAMRFQSAGEMSAALASAAGAHFGQVATPLAPPPSVPGLHLTPGSITPPPSFVAAPARSPSGANEPSGSSALEPVSSPGSLLHGTGEMAQQTSPPKGVSRWPLLAAGILSAVITGGVLFLFVQGNLGGAGDRAAVSEPKNDDESRPGGEEVTGEESDSDGEETTDTAEALPAKLTIEVETTPPGAMVVVKVGGEPLGEPITAPALVPVPPGEEISLVASEDGYRDASLVRSFEKSEKITLELRRTPKKRPKKKKGVTDEDAPMDF